MADEYRKGEIYAELTRLRETAQKMREISESLKKLAREDYAGSLSAVGECWSGDNAQKFLVKAQKAGDETLEAAKKLMEAADTLETIAKTYAETELKAIELISSR